MVSRGVNVGAGTGVGVGGGAGVEVTGTVVAGVEARLGSEKGEAFREWAGVGLAVAPTFSDVGCNVARGSGAATSSVGGAVFPPHPHMNKTNRITMASKITRRSTGLLCRRALGAPKVKAVDLNSTSKSDTNKPLGCDLRSGY